jgi:hypothetical protein
MRRPVAVLALAVLAGGTWATTAPAQDDGVYFDDPDSPGGKEYSIPHERTRRESGSPGGGAGGGGSNGESPRFGVGIAPEDGASGGGGSSGAAGEDAAGDSGSGDRKASGGDGEGATSGEEAAGAAARTGDVEYQATSSSDTQPEVTVSAIALGVLLAGGALGFLLRRSRRDATD